MKTFVTLLGLLVALGSFAQVPSVIISPTDTTICGGQLITLHAIVSDTTSGSLLWSPGDETTESIIVMPSNTTTYTVVYTSMSGAIANTSAVVDVVPVPMMTLLSVPADTIYYGQSVQLVAELAPQQNELTYEWSVDGVSLGSNNSSAEFNAPLTGSSVAVQVSWTSDEGCTITKSIDLVLLPPSYTIPNAFTPNGAKDRTFWPVIDGGVVIEDFRIWGRWGEAIYESFGDPKPWDGTTNGIDCPSDNYKYYFQIRETTGTVRKEQGDVLLIR